MGDATAIMAEHYLRLISLLREYQDERVDMDLAAVAFAVISIRRYHEPDLSSIASYTGIPRETVQVQKVQRHAVSSAYLQCPVQREQPSCLPSAICRLSRVDGGGEFALIQIHVLA